MYGFELNTILLTTTTSFLVAMGALWALSRGTKIEGKSTYNLMIENEAETAFLFENEALVDASYSAHQMLGPKAEGTSDWQRLIDAFSSQFSTLSNDLQALGDAGSLTLLPDDPTDPTRIEAEWWNGLARLQIVDEERILEKPLIDGVSLAALETELETLRRTAKLAPYLVWQETRDGQITWANSAYLALVKRVKPAGADKKWPPARLFEYPTKTDNAAGAQTMRVSITCNDADEALWFDLACKKVNESTLCFATPADEIVRAEASLKGFVQTLTKTFAHLSIGLAVFDKNRQLALFNPALTDMTKLPIEFLSTRPTLFTVLDRLRENQMMPEPKDYKSWRHQMAALEEAATDGTYEEMWTLPSGQTYRVNGRPHPDGAVALLFEDISAEISLTRNFREELEVGQSVLDSFEEAIVVFSSSGLITFSNAAYVTLWGVDPSTTFGEMSIIDAIRSWQDVCDPTPIWGDLRDFIAEQNERVEWFGDATLDDGRALGCQFIPLSGGATLAKFQVQKSAAKVPAKRKVSQKNPAGT